MCSAPGAVPERHLQLGRCRLEFVTEQLGLEAVLVGLRGIAEGGQGGGEALGVDTSRHTLRRLNLLVRGRCREREVGPLLVRRRSVKRTVIDAACGRVLVRAPSIEPS